MAIRKVILVTVKDLTLGDGRLQAVQQLLAGGSRRAPVPTGSEDEDRGGS